MSSPKSLFICVILLCIAAACSRPDPVLTGETGSAGDDRPNIVVIVVDDVGYTDLGAYGSEIETPNINALAHDGIMFTQFYAASTCSPTRSMLLTGTDNHLSGMGSMYREQAENQLGRPGYEGHLNFQVATVAELLRDAGYHTYMTGKWHLGYGDDTSPAARGFEQSFASLAGGGSHFDMMPMVGPGIAPYRDNHVMIDELPEGFYSTQFFTRKIIDYIDDDRAESRDNRQPFFAYLAYTAPHWPLQAPEDSIARQRGNYDSGYDELLKNRIAGLQELGFIPEEIAVRPRIEGELPWDALDPDEQARQARIMEVYAAMIADIDIYVGEFVRYLKSIDEFDNTFILFMSDNGAEGHEMDQSIRPMGPWIEECCDNSLENIGRPYSFVWPGPNWARASTGPWRMFKGFAAEGGIRVPAVIHYPQLSGGRINHQVQSVLDMTPTFLELAGIEHPGTRYQGREIHPLQGVSILPVLRGETESVHADDHVIGWELFGKTGLRQGDWKIIQEPEGAYFERHRPIDEAYQWQLFNLADDPGETRDLSRENPEKLSQMLELWDRYAQENNVIIPEEVMGY